MKKLRWLCGIALMLALSACGQVKNETEYLSKVDDVKEYEDDKLSSILESFDIVPLETNDAALLAEPYCIVLRDNYIYILDIKMSGNEIHLYDSDGKYIRHIGQKGQGPNDYLGGLHIAVNGKGMLSLPDRIRSEIINYTQEGEFVSRIRMDTISMIKDIFLNDSLLLVQNFYKN